MPVREKTGKGMPFRFMYGNGPRGWYYTRGKNNKDVNLYTKDPDEALRRQREFNKTGRKDFSADSAARAGANVVESLTGTGSATTLPVVDPPAAPAPSLQPAAPLSPASPALPSVSAPPAALPPVNGAPPPPSIVPDAVLPPPPGWAEGVRAAAAEASSSVPPGQGDDGETLTPDMIEDLINGATEYAVGLQLWAQAWLAAHAKPVFGINIKVAEVPETAKGVLLGRKIWRRWFGKLAEKYALKLQAPDWVLAPIMVASLTLPIQFGPGAEAMKDEPKKETAPGASAPVAAVA